MTKEQALQRIEELKQFVEESDREPGLGSLYRHIDGHVFLVSRVNGAYVAILVSRGQTGQPIGTTYCDHSPFGGFWHKFTFLGAAEDLLTIKS